MREGIIETEVVYPVRNATPPAPGALMIAALGSTVLKVVKRGMKIWASPDFSFKA